LKDAGDLRERGIYGERLEIKEGVGGSSERSNPQKNKRTEVLRTARCSLRKVTYALWASSYLRATRDCQGK